MSMRNTTEMMYHSGIVNVVFIYSSLACFCKRKENVILFLLSYEELSWHIHFQNLVIVKCTVAYMSFFFDGDK